MDIRKVKKLIEMLENSNLEEIEIQEGEESVRLVKSNGNIKNISSSQSVAVPQMSTSVTPEEESQSEEEVNQETLNINQLQSSKQNHLRLKPLNYLQIFYLLFF